MTKTSNHERKLMLLDTSSAFWTVLLLDDSASRACHVSEKYTIPLDGAFGCPHVHPLCTKRYVSTRDHKTFFPYFSGRANSISQQSTADSIWNFQTISSDQLCQFVPLVTAFLKPVTKFRHRPIFILFFIHF